MVAVLARKTPCLSGYPTILHALASVCLKPAGAQQLRKYSMVVPETVLFAVDLDEECAQPVGKDWSRLDVIKHAITNFVQAKKWSSAAHKFGLISVHQDTCSLHPLGATSHADRFFEALQSLQPSTSAAQHDTPGMQEWQPTNSTSPSKPFDLGSLIAAVAPLQQTLRSNAVAARHMHGGVLTPVSNGSVNHSSNSGSNVKSSEAQQLLRVVLVYCRSKLPAPVWQMHKQAGLAVDCLHVHDKPQPGEQQQQLQEVYSTLETLVDKMAMRTGHASLIYESTAKNLGKLLSCMSVMLSHPSLRPPQALAKPPVDLAAADLQPLPSDAANLASGVPIVSPAKLPAAAAGAWAKPLGAPAAAAGPSASPEPMDYEVYDAAAYDQPPLAANNPWQQPYSESVVEGVPVGCVEGVPDADAPTIGMNLEQGVVVGFDASRSRSSSLEQTDSAATPAFSIGHGSGGQQGFAQQGAAGVASQPRMSTSDAELADLAESLQVSAVEQKDTSACYPKIS